ncbi:MAG: hypothetical protein N3A57_07850, partial [Negativicutes bacterium]|nr:hypothetical protein [Negativicutes bacterium]
TIDILTNYATVNAAPVEQLDRVLADEIYCGCDDGVMSELGRLLPAVGLSRYDGQLLARMWMNFRSGESARVCNPSLWAAALIRTFAKVNAIKIGDFEALAGLAGVSAAAVGKAAHRIETALDIWPFDVRFLNEDGFMSYLYSYLHKLTEGLTKEEG